MPHFVLLDYLPDYTTIRKLYFRADIYSRILQTIHNLNKILDRPTSLKDDRDQAWTKLAAILLSIALAIDLLDQDVRTAKESTEMGKHCDRIIHLTQNEIDAPLGDEVGEFLRTFPHELAEITKAYNLKDEATQSVNFLIKQEWRKYWPLLWGDPTEELPRRRRASSDSESSDSPDSLGGSQQAESDASGSEDRDDPEVLLQEESELSATESLYSLDGSGGES